LKDQLLIANSQWQSDSEQIKRLLEEYHQNFPLRKGMPKEEIKSRLKLPAKIFNAKVSSWIDREVIEEFEHYLRIPGHKITYSDRQNDLVAGLVQKFRKSPFSPPTVKECQDFAGDEVYQSLVDTGVLVQLSPEVVFRKEDYEQLVNDVKKWLSQKGTITVAEFRDRFTTSRRYALAFLEHLDRIKITVRDGDHRKIR
jgi:selenocysteine-specific elongation factor